MQVVEWVLVGLFAVWSVYQQYFYTKLVRELVERLSARDLRDYEMVKNPPPPRPKPKQVEIPIESFDRIMG